MQYKITLHVLHLLDNVTKFEICYTICNIIRMHEINLYIAISFYFHQIGVFAMFVFYFTRVHVPLA